MPRVPEAPNYQAGTARKKNQETKRNTHKKRKGEGGVGEGKEGYAKTKKERKNNMNGEGESEWVRNSLLLMLQCVQ